MNIKQIINLSPVSSPTWAKMCTTTKDVNGWHKNIDDWWYVEIVQWANVLYTDGDDEQYPAIFGCYIETEKDGGGIAFVEELSENHLHYTTERPAYMDCVDIRDGSGVKKTTRLSKFAAVQKEALIEALDRAKGNKKIAAKLLGVHRATIFNVIKKYNLQDTYIKQQK